ncbi:MAG: fibronectin type III domain-containing protein [Thermoplasmata archaeon]
MKKLVVITLIFFLFSGQLLFPHASGAPALTAPFRIDSDSAFHAMAAAESWPGSGASADPYIIQDCEVNGTSSGKPYGMYIGNTTLHFKILGCYIHHVPGSVADDNYFNSGIIIYNARNGAVQNSTLESNHCGIHLASCENITVTHNNFLINDVQAYDDGTNSWHAGYPAGGNHWSDWTSPDADSDGFVDEHYQVRGVEPTGTLTIIFLEEVGTGDGTLIISPSGEAMLIDAGSSYNGDSTLAVMASYGISKLKYTVATHYHEDHIGSMDEVIYGLGGSSTAITGYCYDRGYFYDTSMYYDYVDAVGAKRRQIKKWDVLDLGGGVTLTCLGLNGNGVSNLKGENEYGIALRLDFGAFQAFFGGDIGGYNDYSHNDIESTVAPDAGRVEVYQVNHHGSAYSSNTNFMNTIRPKASVFSAGYDNGNGHPTYSAYSRVKATGSFMYYTTPGDGAPMLPGDGRVVSDNIILTTDGYTFSITKKGGAFTDNYDCWQDFGGVNHDLWPFTSLNAWITTSQTTVPLEPLNFQGTGLSGQVNLTWSPPESDGGSPITGHKVYRGSGPDDAAVIASIGNLTHYEDGAVTNGQTYYYTVSALNSEGEGKMSMGIYVTPAAVPSEPLNLQASSGDGRVTLDWSPPSYDGTSPVLDYRVYRGTSIDDIAYMGASGAALSYVDRAVVNGMTYYYQVSAANANGEGERSAMVQATPMVGSSEPSAPRELAVIPGNNSAVLAWEPPLSDGNSMLQGYNIYRGISSNSMGLVASIGNVRSWVDFDIIPGQAYHYSVRAVNGVGEGVSSNVVEFQLEGMPPEAELGTESILAEFWWVFAAIILALAILLIVASSRDPPEPGKEGPGKWEMPSDEPGGHPPEDTAEGNESSRLDLERLPPAKWER